MMDRTTPAATSARAPEIPFEKTLGKIVQIYLGFRGEEFGIFTELSFGGQGANDFKEAPTTGVDASDFLINTKQLLVNAKVQKFEQLVGKPVEVTTQGKLLRSWRILSEVL